MLTVSIVVHKTPLGVLEKALDSVLHCPVSLIYIIDNGPTTRLSIVSEKDPRINYFHIENRGFGAAHNVALKEVIERNPQGYHLVMNPDVYWKGDVLTPLMDYMESHPDVGMAMPKVFYPDGALQYTCRMLPSPVDLFAKRFLPAPITKKRMNKYLLAHHDHDKPLNCPYLLGSFLFFRNRAIVECGRFDERFFMYPEDIDITRRIHEKWKTMYLPIVSIVHAHAAESRRNKRMLRIHIRNMIKYFNKWGWVFDKKRKETNARLLDSVIYISPEKRPNARG